MTPKQKERVLHKIKKIKAALAADKKQWGGYYHDGSGLRYMPPKLYIQIEEYTGGLRYFNWFDKNFPRDGAYPNFIFEWAIILFKTKRQSLAEKKIFRLFCDNAYFLDVFLGQTPKVTTNPSNYWQQSLEETKERMVYAAQQSNLEDFADWLKELVGTQKFINFCSQFMALQVKLKAENEPEKRGKILDEMQVLQNNY